MNRRSTTAALVTAAVAAGVGIAMLATPVVANSAQGGRTTAGCPVGAVAGGSGSRLGNRMGNQFGNRMGMGAPGGDLTTNLPAQGTLTSAQKSALAGMAEEEKLAHDVYVTLGAVTGDQRFSRIATSESRHLSAARVLLERYGVSDPTAGRAEGSFATASVQGLYDRLVAAGSESSAAALAVGRTIETTDLADLASAAKGVTAADVSTVYQRLSAGSRNHLAAFGG